MNRQILDELNSLSLEVFGAKSRWRKFVERGELYTPTEIVDLLTIKDDKEQKEKKEIPLMHEGPNGGSLERHSLKRYTLDSIKDKMLELKIQKEKINELIKNKEKEKSMEELKAKIQKGSGSSALK